MKYVPTLETERLIIRPITLDDVEEFYAMDSQPEVHLYLNRSPLKSNEEAKDYIKGLLQQYETHGIGRVAVIEKATNQLIGWTGFKFIEAPMNDRINFLDFGYRYRKESWGKGYATEAALACIAFYYKNLTHIPLHASTHVDNQASRKVLEKVGFKITDTFKFTIWDIDCYWYEREALSAK